VANKILSSFDPWAYLKQYTTARIALGRAGGSLKTDDWLAFKLAHAKARDAVHQEFDSEGLARELEQDYEMVLSVASQIKERATFLKRPDLGRCLDERSKNLLKQNTKPSDIVFIVSDGLSATAVHAHAKNMLAQLLPKISAVGWSLAPIVVARFARVALEDEVGALLGAKMAVIIIGERPGLSSPHSMGAYIVHNPRVGNTDADRNCVSNIRAGGLSYTDAADTIFYLLEKARHLQLSGVRLKDNRQQLEVLKAK
jgi:ethanolamine ammonia-lyase small subunit